MAPQQREARQAYRELMKAKNRAPKQRPDRRQLPLDNREDLKRIQNEPEPPPQPAPPPGDPPAPASEKQSQVPDEQLTPTATADKSEQQRAARQAYKERMQSKGYTPSKTRGKKAQPRGEQADASQAWSAGDSKEKTQASDAKTGVMDFFPGKKNADQVVELPGAVGTAEPAADAAAAQKDAGKRAKQEDKERRKQDAVEAKARKKRLAEEAKESKRREKEEAKRAKKEGKSTKEALYADPEPEVGAGPKADISGGAP